MKGRTFTTSDGIVHCDECCNKDRCDDPSHKYRPNGCEFCGGTGLIPPDRAEKCAEGNKRLARIDELLYSGTLVGDGSLTLNGKEAAELKRLIRSHYPDDRELLEAARDVIRLNDIPVSDNVASDLVLEERAMERLRTAIERRG